MYFFLTFLLLSVFFQPPPPKTKRDANRSVTMKTGHFLVVFTDLECGLVVGLCVGI